MRSCFSCTMLVLAVLFLATQGAKGAVSPLEISAQELGIVPQPVSVQAFQSTYMLPSTTRIVASNEDERNVAAFLTEFLKTRRITAIIVPAGKDAAIRLSTDAHDVSIGPEGYRLAVTDSGVAITANAGAGLFYGLQTLEQLFPAPPSTTAVIHQVRIVDSPEYKWRGIMLDVSRHFFSVSFIEQLIDVAASYKLNTFHWHLVDDQAWRIEIKKYPRLTQVGSCGDHDHPLGTAPCMFYTQQQIRDVVEYAKKRYVRIVPEIEMPGHSSAALAAYPQLACKPVTGSAYCPSEQTFTFLDNVLDEVMELFPGTYIHTGGDEVVPKPWNASSVAQAVMRQHHLNDAHALQGWFDRRIEDYLTQHGRHMVGWDEILAGGVSKDAIVMSWRGTNGGILAAAHGNDVVMAPNIPLYFNGYQGPPAWEPLGKNRIDTLRDVYAYGPDLRDLSPDERNRVLGPEASLWTEWVPTTDIAWLRLFPRTLALAEMAWTSPGQKHVTSAPMQKDWNSFQQRTINQYPRLEARGITFFIPGPFELQDTTTDKGYLDVSLTSPVKTSTMYYTLDGSYPTTSSARYDAPISIALSPGQEVRLRVVTVLWDGRTSSPAEASYIRRLQNVSK